MHKMTSIYAAILLGILSVLPQSSLRADVISVCKDGGGDYGTIQAAIDAASLGDEVVICQGVYFETINYNGKNITVRSTDPDDPDVVATTIINGDADQDPKTTDEAVVTFENGESQDATLSGLTITNGKAAYSGGGIRCWESNPTITNCTIRGNVALAGSGGGIYCYSGNPKIINCIISDNISNAFGGGFDCGYESMPQIINCTIRRNKSRHGGGIYSSRSNLVITNCDISENQTDRYGGGGIACEVSDLAITNCRISHNTTGQTYNGGGFYCSNHSIATLTNCSIIGNETYRYGGGIHIYIYCNLTLKNCILWGNIAQEGTQLYSVWHNTVTASNCDIQGGWEGTGNINTDPLFANMETGDFQLLPDSPCIDAGDNAAVPTDITEDLNKNPRIVDGKGDGIALVDMGAYEYQPPTIIATLNILPGDGRNPFVPNKKSKGRLPMAILATEEVAADNIDTNSIKIAGAIRPVKTSLDKDIDGDGLIDLVMHFARRELIDALSLDTYPVGTAVDITVTAARIEDGYPIIATDSIVIAGPSK